VRDEAALERLKQPPYGDYAVTLIATTERSNAASIGVMRRLGMDIQRNPDAQPGWFQTVGVLFNPSHDQAPCRAS
jgi:hypothetical protein